MSLLTNHLGAAQFQLLGASLVQWILLHFLADFLWKYHLGSRFQSFSHSSQLAFPEKIVSSLHGILLTSLSIYSVFIVSHFESSRLHAYITPFHDVYFCQCIAYQIYDLSVMVLQNSDPLAMFLHHILVIIGALFTMTYHSPAFYPIIFGATEVTVLATNGLWYLRSLGYSPSHFLYRLMHLLRSLSMLLFRSWVGPYSLYLFFSSGDFQELTPPVSLLLFVVLTAFTLLNTHWTVAGLKSLRTKSSSKTA